MLPFLEFVVFVAASSAMKKRTSAKHTEPASQRPKNAVKEDSVSVRKSDEVYADVSAKEMDKRVVFRWRTAFLALFTVRLVSAIALPVADCDETFNYWEPSHFLLYGYGLQTWEYRFNFPLYFLFPPHLNCIFGGNFDFTFSPVYALRPYIYVAIHATIGHVVSLFAMDKVLLLNLKFHLLRHIARLKH